MSKKVFKLKKDQYLSDLELKIIQNQSTFLVAPTGAGKTTYTMEELKAQYKLVIILVPTQAKVMELQNEYSGKGSLKSEYLFFVQMRILTRTFVNLMVSSLQLTISLKKLSTYCQNLKRKVLCWLLMNHTRFMRQVHFGMRL
jgi:CRISPR/Cas system-associated endonuclease/helicase Cas3